MIHGDIETEFNEWSCANWDEDYDEDEDIFNTALVLDEDPKPKPKPAATAVVPDEVGLPFEEVLEERVV